MNATYFLAYESLIDDRCFLPTKDTFKPPKNRLILMPNLLVERFPWFAIVINNGNKTSALAMLDNR